MIPKFRAFGGDQATGGSDCTITKSILIVADDWLFVCVVATGGQTLAPPGGWTELITGTSGGDTFGIWWKRAGGAEGSSYTWVTTGGSNPRTVVGVLVAYSGCPTDSAPTLGAVTRQTGVNVTGAGLVPGAGAALVLHVGASASATSNTVRSTAPPGMKERVDNETSSTSGTSAQCQAAISEGAVLPYAFTGDRESTLTFSAGSWGALVVLYQTPLAAGASDGSARETLVELTHWEEGAAAEVVKRYSGRGVTFSGGEFYERRILNSVEIRQHAADRAAVGGVVATTVSDIRLDNSDGALDEIYRRMVAVGRAVTIKTVAVTNETASDLGAGAASNAVSVFVGIVAALTPDGTTMILTVSDLGERLNVPLQLDEFSGASGLGGGAELKGQSMPLALGRCFNIWPQELGNFTLGDGSLYTYMASSRAVNNFTAVYERGVAMTEVGVAPIAGQYREWLASGVFQLGFTPNGIITCTVKGDDPAGADIYANQHGEIVTRMLTLFGPQLSTTDLEATTFTDVDAILPGEIGIHFPTGDRSSARDAIERVLRSGGIWLSGGRNGKIRLAMAMPAPGERIRLTEPDIVALRPIALPASLQPAPHKIEVETERNWHPLTDISSSVTGNLRRQLSGPGRTIESVSTALQLRQKTPRNWTITGLWLNDADGTTRADQIRIWIEQGLRAFEVVTDRYAGQVELGMGCEIASYPRFQLADGFAGIVAGWRERPSDNQLALVLIGGGAAVAQPPSMELREDGGAELREDGARELRE